MHSNIKAKNRVMVNDRSYQNHEVKFISFRDSIDLFPEYSESQMDGAKGVNNV